MLMEPVNRREWGGGEGDKAKLLTFVSLICIKL